MSVATTSSLDAFGAALRGEPCEVVDDAGRVAGSMPVARWSAPADRSDRVVLGHCRGAVLDVGCGPGRMVEQLARAGSPALGIDINPEAVLRTLARGAAAILRDVHAPLPGEGRWGSVLLADGNIGIGGDPRSLLRRARALLAPDGRVVVDLDPPGGGVRTRRLHLRTSSATSAAFAWSTVAADAIASLAADAGLASTRLHRDADRWFAVLEGGGR